MIYLDNAATSWPKPRSVKDAMEAAWTHFGGNPGRGGHKMAMQTSDQIYNVRTAVAEFFHAPDVENVVFTSNCTAALNMAIKGHLKEDGHVIISDMEHNAVARPIYALAKQGNIRYSIAKVVPGDFQETLRNFERSITADTKAIVCSHVSNVFGVVLPVEAIGQLARRHQLIFIVDAAQSAGIFPIDMQRMHITSLCLPGHKGLYGPMGTGVLVTQNGEQMQTLMEGGTGSLSNELEQPRLMPDRLESGTINTSGIIGLGAGIQLVKKHGLTSIYTHELHLIQYLYDALRHRNAIQLYTQRPEAPAFAPLLSFNIRGLPANQVADLLDRENIAVRAGLHCAPLAHRAMGTEQTGTVRIAPSLFTTRHEMDTLIAVLNKLLKNQIIRK